MRGGDLYSKKTMMVRLDRVLGNNRICGHMSLKLNCLYNRIDYIFCIKSIPRIGFTNCETKNWKCHGLEMLSCSRTWTALPDRAHLTFYSVSESGQKLGKTQDHLYKKELNLGT